MRKLIEFVKSIYVAVIFIILEMVALYNYAHSNAYTQARLLVRSNQVVGGVQGLFSQMRHFWSLGTENRRLSERIALLEEELLRYRAAEAEGSLLLLADSAARIPYAYTTARVASTTVNRAGNFIVIDRGSRQGIENEMGLLSPEGAIAGYVVSVSKNYAAAISVLNPKFQASGKLRNDPTYYGSLRWEGTDSRYIILDELPKYADIHEGDEIVTTGFSNYFAPDMPIGTVASFELNEMKTYYTVKVRLAADLSALSEVIVLRNNNLEELKGLEEKLKKRYR